MRTEKLMDIFDDAQRRGKAFICVKIETEGNAAPEIIINPEANFEAKRAYYSKAYSDDLRLIAAKDKVIRIVDALATSNLNDLNWFAY